MNEMNQDDELLAELFDAQPQPVFWMKPVFENGEAVSDFLYAYCNREMLRFAEVSREQLIGKSIKDSPLLNEELKQRFLHQLLRVYHSGETHEESVYNPRLNKYYTFLRSRVREGVLMVLQDRTREYQMIRELEQKNTLLDNIMKYSPSGISVTKVMCDREGKISDAATLLANDKAVKFTGLSRDDYIGKTAREIDPGIFESPIYQMTINTLETGQPFHTQYFIEPTKRWLELSVSKMDDEHLVNVFTDITETKEVQLKMEKTASMLNTVFNTIHAGMFTFQPEKNEDGELVDFRFALVNPAFSAYVGQDPQTLQGCPGSQWFPGYLTNGVFDMYKHTYLTGESQRKEVHYNVDGLDIYLDLQCVRIDDEVLVTFTDYTAVKKAQNQLEKTIEELKRSNSNLEDFAHAASHDLKEPIRKINYFSERLKQQFGSLLDAEGLNTFHRLEVATERMRSLVDDLLEYSHVSLLPRKFEKVDLNEVMEKVCEDLDLVMQEKDARIRIGTLPTAHGHKLQLQQLFQNLLINALKYNKPGTAPEISIGYRKVTGVDIPDIPAVERAASTFHRIEVRDSGIGFEQLHAERIFQMFQRLHGNSEYKGTGVGLSIVKKVIQNHNGYISAKSEPGEGAVFTIYLPDQEGSDRSS